MKNTHLFLSSLGTALLLAGIVAAPLQAHHGDSDDGSFIDSKPIKRPPPKYPIKEAKHSNAGVVEIMFMVDKEGNVSKPMVHRSSRPTFEESALKAVLDYRYEPARLNDEPVQSVQQLRALYEMADTKDQVKAKFASSYKKALKEFKGGAPKRARVEKYIRVMESGDHMSPYSYAHLNIIKYQYAGKFGSKQELIDSIENMLLFEEWSGERGKFIDDETRVSLRRNLVTLYVQTQQYGDALDSFEELKKIDVEAESIYAPALEKIKELSENDQLIAVQIRVHERGYTSAQLFKKTFTMVNIEGRIDGLKLRCDRAFRELVFKSDAQYQIPRSWGGCNLQIIGEPGTTASLAQN